MAIIAFENLNLLQTSFSLPGVKKLYFLQPFTDNDNNRPAKLLFHRYYLKQKIIPNNNQIIVNNNQQEIEEELTQIFRQFVEVCRAMVIFIAKNSRLIVLETQIYFVIIAFNCVLD